MAVLFSPFGNDQFIDTNGDPAIGYTVTTYAAGSSTLLATYTDSTGGAANENPVELNASGVNPDGQFWLTSGLSYKFVVKDADGVTVRTVDNVTGVNDPSVLSVTDEWVAYSGAPTYISATSFSAPGDQTSTLHIGRRLKTTNSGGTVYSTITGSSFGAGITTVTVANASGTLDSGLSAVSYGLASYANTSLPIIAFGRSSTYSDATASRAINTTYTNNTGKPLFVAASVAGTTNASTVSIGWTVGAVGGISQSSLIAGTPASNTTLGASAIVPPGSTYRLAVTQGSLSQWLEMS